MFIKGATKNTSCCKTIKTNATFVSNFIYKIACSFPCTKSGTISTFFVNIILSFYVISHPYIKVYHVALLCVAFLICGCRYNAQCSCILLLKTSMRWSTLSLRSKKWIFLAIITRSMFLIVEHDNNQTSKLIAISCKIHLCTDSLISMIKKLNSMNKYSMAHLKYAMDSE